MDMEKWKYSIPDHGIVSVKLSGWDKFAEFINEELKEYKTYIYKGQANYKWSLESSLDRALTGIGKADKWQYMRRHLDDFKKSALGRRGQNPAPIEHREDWWSLGQHYGLKTPLLDWTESPFVALYFAFEDENDENSEYRVI